MSTFEIGIPLMPSFDDFVKSMFEVFKPSEPKKQGSAQAKTFKIPEPPKDLIQKTRWVKSHERIEINGISICGPTFYFGSDLKNSNGYPEPSLINPLMRASSTIDDASYAVDPSYIKFTPYQRHKYLEWLASNCVYKAPNAFVFLYFYGLERRALLDGMHDVEILKEVKPEIERLSNTYSVISVYAEPLLLHIDTLIADGSTLEELDVKNALYVAGRYTAQKLPVPTSLIAPIILNTNSVRKSKYISVCPELVQKVITFLYGDELAMERCFTYKNIEYKPVSSGLRGIPFVSTSKALELLTSRSNINKLQDIATAVSDSLEEYAKYLLKNPTHRNTLEANLMLPVYLYPESLRITLKNLKYETDGYHLVDMPLETLLSSLNSDGSISKDKYTRILSALNYESVGLYPDMFKTGMDLKAPVILYSLDKNQVANKKDLELAELFIDLIAWSSSKDTHFEDSHVFEQITKFDIGANECKYLAASAKFKCLNNKNPSGLKQKLKELSEQERTKIADLFVTLAKYSDSIEAADIKQLESVFKLLDLEQTALYSALHSDDAQQVSDNKASGLDMAKIKALQKETSEVASLLHAVFNSEDNQDATPSIVCQENVLVTTPLSDQKTYIGLSVKASMLLEIIRTDKVWKKDALKVHADELGLMIDGVIEQINDACFDAFDDPLIDGDEVLEINQDLLEKVFE